MKKEITKLTLITVTLIVSTLNIKCTGGTKTSSDSATTVAKDSSNDTSGTGSGGPKRLLSDSSNDTSGTGSGGPKTKFVIKDKVKVIKP